MTGKIGFILGNIFGIIAYSASVGLLTFNPAPTGGMNVSKSIIGSLAIASTLLTFWQYHKKHSFFSTTADGFIAGFAAIIDVFAISISFF